MIDQQPNQLNRSALAIPQLTDTPTDRRPLDTPPDDLPDPPFVELTPAAVLVEEPVTLVVLPFPDGVEDGNLLTTLHDAEALADVEPGV